jgi:hypothetical protein
MKLKSIAFLVGLVGFSGTASATPWIHEVFYDAEGADSSHVFTEIAGAPGLSLDGFRLAGIDGATGLVYRTLDLTGALIPEDGLLVVATSRALDAVLSVRDFVGDVDWQNGPEAIQLWDAVGTVIDALQYGDAGALQLGEGLFAPDAASGFSLTRDLLGSDTGDNRTDFQIATPTPGTGRNLASAPVPEPAMWPAVVLGLLLTGRASSARRPVQEAPEAPRALGSRRSC